ncbi:iron-containing alcohol dehydrogenase [Frisingicoccus sp.]|uniref:iron-containing alcohol dehydrogenase n=1 Tax=Frisingicoccus sp. TaxID=1918627 RepID=UPI002EB99E10|nr:iron-containing alcohol dehydrogenase [Frisingicoccus sp.]
MMKIKERPCIHPKNCAGCSVCVENCPMDCIRIKEPEFHGDIHTIAEVDVSKCIGCGICAKVCPIDAIEMRRGGEAVCYMEKKWNLETVFCRGFQSVMKVGMYCLPWGIPKVLKGPGAVKKLPAAIKRKKFHKVLVVTDQMLMGLHLLDGMLEAMDKAGLEYVIYDHVAPNPTNLNVEEGLALYKDCRCDCIIAFGGGSPMDCAKGIGARAARPKKSVEQLQGLFRVLRPLPTIFAVPTTAGTGSETTVAAVITDAKTHHKASMNDICLMPKYAVMDPELTVGLPPQVTATTGMDALCHAVEAYTNNTYNTKLEKEMCKKAVKLIYDNLYLIYQDGTNLKGRYCMQKAAFYAGRAFTRGCVGYVHAIGHTLGGLYGTPHGLAMATLLPHVMRAFGPAAYEKLADLCDVCGIEAEDDSSKAKAEAFIRWIEDMKVKMDIPLYPPTIKEEDVDQIVEWAHKEGNPLYPTPVVWTKTDFKEFISSLKES